MRNGADIYVHRRTRSLKTSTLTPCLGIEESILRDKTEKLICVLYFIFAGLQRWEIKKRIREDRMPILVEEARH